MRQKPKKACNNANGLFGEISLRDPTDEAVVDEMVFYWLRNMRCVIRLHYLEVVDEELIW